MTLYCNAYIVYNYARILYQVALYFTRLSDMMLYYVIIVLLNCRKRYLHKNILDDIMMHAYIFYYITYHLKLNFTLLL